MPKDDFRMKPKTQIIRLLLSSAIVVSIFKNPELMEHICGPFTFSISQKRNLIIFIIFSQIFRICYKVLVNMLGKVPLLKWVPDFCGDLLVVKYFIVLLVKIVLIFQQQHRKKFYLHSFLLEAIILITAILFDCMQRANIKQAGQLLLIDGLHRLSLVYELTQTFCPNLILYYAVSNLLIFVMGQVQAQDRFGLKQSLYVKHDVYRFMFMSVLFFGMLGLAQLSSANFKMLLTFLLCLRFFMSALSSYNQSNFSSALNYLMLSGLIMAASELLFLGLPFMLVPEP